ncbi:hypothetical protein [Leeia aquatica]|uniref:Uncharacterized protein n=1 Tax=Leeia aquatica TaxID=2725557 RepID=A0A847S4R1_9NEIS|nr:hypothetical protein [Leeia aquatica]NLR74784.1 hypothetical protein [Leeia aquatica]
MPSAAPERGARTLTGHIIRANHPTRPLALWLSYSLPKPGSSADGELSVAFFDGERNSVWRGRLPVAADLCAIDYEQERLQMDRAVLGLDHLSGAAPGVGYQLSWELSSHPLADQLPAPAALPDGSSYSPPHLLFNGMLWLDNEPVEVKGWLGSRLDDQGLKMFERQAWAQVVGFDNSNHAYLECSTQKLSLGKDWAPWMSVFTLHYAEAVYVINVLADGIREDSHSGLVVWSFDVRQSGVRIHGQIQAQLPLFARFSYPVAGHPHTCLHTKLANCIVTLVRPGKPPVTLSTLHRASFEVRADQYCNGCLVVNRMPVSAV